MAVREVALIGDPILRQVARTIRPDEVGGTWLRALLDDMIDTMHELGGIGIAAPQVKEPVQLAIVEIDADSDRYPGMSPQALTVFINPRVTILDGDEQEYWEGCLSVPDLRGLVARPRKVRVDYTTLTNEPASLTAEGFLATVLQHEIDHLEGVLFVDKVRDPTKLATLENYRRYWLERDDSASEI